MMPLKSSLRLAERYGCELRHAVTDIGMQSLAYQKSL